MNIICDVYKGNVILGWNSYFEEQYKIYKENDLIPARVITELRNYYRILSEKEEFLAQISSKMNYVGICRNDYPAVGDWVLVSFPKLLDRAIIHKILPRLSKFSRKIPGREKDEQILAANVDFVFIVSGLYQDFNIRRIERYLTIAWESGANPIIVLNKTDLCDNLDEILSKTEKVGLGAPVHLISCYSEKGMDQITQYDKPGSIIALLGSSGVGKSTIINHLLKYNAQKTNILRHGDNKGRHTTSSRELFILPNGGMIIDTPGMRELQLFGTQDATKKSFEDISIVAMNCRFTDCKHESEPGYAVREAIEKGELDENRLISYKKLQKEIKFISQKNNRINNDKYQWLKSVSKLRKKV